MSILQAIGRLLGVKAAFPTPDEGDLRWQEALERYRQSEAQVRECTSPEQLELAHRAWLSAQADLQWCIRLAKRDRGLPIRSVTATQERYQAMLEFLHREAPGDAVSPDRPQ